MFLVYTTQRRCHRSISNVDIVFRPAGEFCQMPARKRLYQGEVVSGNLYSSKATDRFQSAPLLCLLTRPAKRPNLSNACWLKSPTWLQVDNKSVTQCAKDAKECGGLRYAYFQCKRGQVDARNRITGNKGYWSSLATTLAIQQIQQRNREDRPDGAPTDWHGLTHLEITGQSAEATVQTQELQKAFQTQWQKDSPK